MYSKWNFLSRASKHFISVSHVIPQTFFFLREKVCTFKCKLHLGRRHEHQKSSSTVEGNHIRITVYSSLKISPQVKALNKNQTNDKSTCKIKQTKILSKLLSVVEIMKYELISSLFRTNTCSYSFLNISFPRKYLQYTLVLVKSLSLCSFFCLTCLCKRKPDANCNDRVDKAYMPTTQPVRCFVFRRISELSITCPDIDFHKIHKNYGSSCILQSNLVETDKLI